MLLDILFLFIINNNILMFSSHCLDLDYSLNPSVCLAISEELVWVMLFSNYNFSAHDMNRNIKCIVDQHEIEQYKELLLNL